MGFAKVQQGKDETGLLGRVGRVRATHADRLELGTLPAGTYIYKVSKGRDKMTGKVTLT